MEIVLSKYAGFCEGVARAYDIVEKIAKDPETRRPVFVLGSLVHNSDVVARIEKMGVGKISIESDLTELLKSKKIGTLVITAHGMGPKIFKIAEENGINLVDTTCPKVIKVQRLAKNFSEKNYQLVIVGEKNHKEIKGVYEWAGEKASVVETNDDLEKLSLDSSQKIAVVSQTTQNQDFFDKVSQHISKKYPDAEIVNTICQATQNRQNEIKELAENSDAVVVIGSPESANSNQLWEIAQKVNPKSHFIQHASELQKQWFSGCKKVAVTAGASTPKWVIDDVMDKLRSAW